MSKYELAGMRVKTKEEIEAMERPAPIQEPVRYFLDRDCDTHWYLIPVARREEWQKWVSLDADDVAAWDVPDFAQSLGGSYTRLTFTDPRETD